MSNAGSPLPAGTVDGQALIWSAAQRKWIAATPPSAATGSLYRAHFLAGGGSFANATDTAVACDHVDVDDGANNSAGTFKCPATGYYHVDCAIASNSAFHRAAIMVNGAPVAHGAFPANAPGPSVVSATIKCNVNDIIALGIHSGQNGTVVQAGTDANDNFITVVRVA